MSYQLLSDHRRAACRDRGAGTLRRRVRKTSTREDAIVDRQEDETEVAPDRGLV